MNRTERINLRVTADEKARLEAAAEAECKTLTAYILGETVSPEQRFVFNAYLQAIAEAESPRQIIRILENARKDGDISSSGLACLTKLAETLSHKY